MTSNINENAPNEAVEQPYTPEQILRYAWAKASLAQKIDILKQDGDFDYSCYVYVEDEDSDSETMYYNFNTEFPKP